MKKIFALTGLVAALAFPGVASADIGGSCDAGMIDALCTYEDDNGRTRDCTLWDGKSCLA